MTKPAPPQMKLVSQSPLNAETPPQAWQEPLTPNGLFYVRNHFEMPQIDAQTWRLSLGGALASPRAFTLDELKAMPSVSQRVLLECAGNGRSALRPAIKGTAWGFGAVAQAEFTGTPLINLLAMVHPKAEAVELLFTGADSGPVRTGAEVPYARSLPMAEARGKDVLLAWAMNGEDLPLGHGYPLRLLVPGRYGMASVKWLQKIEALTIPFQGFFQVDDYVYVQAEGFADGAPVGAPRVRALFASHEDGQEIPKGVTTLSGPAWSGTAPIDSVQVSIDGGEHWISAEVSLDPSPYAWARWQAELDLSEVGEYLLAVRARDAAGNQQPMTQYWNKGGYGNNLVQRIRLLVK